MEARLRGAAKLTVDAKQDLVHVVAHLPVVEELCLAGIVHEPALAKRVMRAKGMANLCAKQGAET